MYVGITNNFDRRMHEHRRSAYDNNSQITVHKAMRKHSHKTEIWAEGINDRELINTLEIQTIQQLKDMGYTLYNMTDGGEGATGVSRPQELRDRISKSVKALGIKGQNHYNAYTKDMYSKIPTFPNNFKRACKSMGWDMDDFERVFAEWHYRTDGQRERKYLFIYKGDLDDC